MKKNTFLSNLVLVCFSLFVVFGFSFSLPVLASGAGSVVINEVAWAGSLDSANDEWIELYNTTPNSIDLNGWYIDDDNGASVYYLSGSISGYGYYLIEKREDAVTTYVADLIVNLSLANSGDSLILYNSDDVEIDAVNSSGGAWFAGNTSSYATMERINPFVSGDDPDNWANGVSDGATASLGALISGTPLKKNSSFLGQDLLPNVSMSSSNTALNVGDEVIVSVEIDNVLNLFSYGLEVLYDRNVFELLSVSKSGFLSEGETVSTSFQYGLENGTEGKLLIAEARTLNEKIGVSGSGKMFDITFKVVDSFANQTDIIFGESSFISDLVGENLSNFSGISFTANVFVVEPVFGLKAQESLHRYAIELSWNASLGATSYDVFRMNAHGDFVLLGETSSTFFVDDDLVLTGGNIIPNHNYNYRVVAKSGGVVSEGVEVFGVDTRGIKGDNNRSDRVDGRDLDRLARVFALTDTDFGFDPLVDTTFDGAIDGSDLIDLGVNFALSYL